MDKNASFYVAILLMAVVVATVTSFGGDDMGGFGGDYYDRKYQVFHSLLGGKISSARQVSGSRA